MVFLIGFAVLLAAFVSIVLFKAIRRRRRRLWAEERARQDEKLRQKAINEADDDGIAEYFLSKEEERLIKLESVTSMVKEHPEDAATVVRTWILDDLEFIETMLALHVVMPGCTDGLREFLQSNMETPKARELLARLAGRKGEPLAQPGLGA